MRRYNTRDGSSSRISYGVQLIAGLKTFPETAPLAAPLEEANQQLSIAYAERVANEQPLAESNASVRFADYNVDTTIRKTARAAQIADGGRRGPVSKELFPNGVTPVTKPYGAKQVQPTNALLGRMKATTNPAAKAVVDAWLPQIEAELGPLETAVSAQAAAEAKLQDAFHKERAVREDHLRVVERIAGTVRATFPGDRQKQNAVFPRRRPPKPVAPPAPVQ